MYNTHFIVKYHDIKTDLLTNLFNKQIKEDNFDIIEQDYKYNQYDIEVICGKLYRDEFLTVFYANSIFDDIIDINMRKLYNLIILDNVFNKFIQDINIQLTNNQLINNDECNNDNQYIIFMCLFKEELFYLSHKLICEFINSQNINNDLLVIIKNKTLELLK
jgi:hypothetical protein